MRDINVNTQASNSALAVLDNCAELISKRNTQTNYEQYFAKSAATFVY